MRKRVWIGILLCLLLILVSGTLAVLAERIGSELLRSFAIVAPASLVGDIFSCYFSKDGSRKPFRKSRKEWLAFAIGVLIVSSLLWIFEKFVF